MWRALCCVERNPVRAKMVRVAFQALQDHEAKLFAAAIPKSVERPETTVADEYLRKDQVLLLERFFYFLEEKQEHGSLVLDEVDKAHDRRFVRRLEAYFRKTHTGRYRTAWIVPTPLFVASDMTPTRFDRGAHKRRRQRR